MCSRSTGMSKVAYQKLPIFYLPVCVFGEKLGNEIVHYYSILFEKTSSFSHALNYFSLDSDVGQGNNLFFHGKYQKFELSTSYIVQ